MFQKGASIFFMGGGVGIADKVSQKLKEKIPGLNVVGTFSPPFRLLTEKEETYLAILPESSRFPTVGPVFPLVRKTDGRLR